MDCDKLPVTSLRVINSVPSSNLLIISFNTCLTLLIVFMLLILKTISNEDNTPSNIVYNFITNSVFIIRPPSLRGIRAGQN